MRNLKLAIRTLGRTPFVTTVAAVSLGLGIGANSAIYSIFYRMVRQQLPVAGAERLVNFSAPGPKNGSVSCGQAGPCDDVISYPMFRDLQKAKLSAFTGIAGHRDSFFRRLEDISKGDFIELVTLQGTSVYEVDQIRVTTPADLSPLQPRAKSSLTLVTCYPFQFIGPAPSRYIVEASLSNESFDHSTKPR